MKAIIILAPLLAIALIYLMYKKENDMQKMLFSFVVLASIIALGIIGNIMRAIMPMYLTHFVAVALSYGGLIYYIFREKKPWLFWSLPLLTLLLYLLLVWVGNEHL